MLLVDVVGLLLELLVEVGFTDEFEVVVQSPQWLDRELEVLVEELGLTLELEVIMTEVLELLGDVTELDLVEVAELCVVVQSPHLVVEVTVLFETGPFWYAGRARAVPAKAARTMLNEVCIFGVLECSRIDECDVLKT